MVDAERVGGHWSFHPFNERRRLEYPYLKDQLQNPRRTLKTLAFYVEFSLIIRLLVRLPMRQRQIREMVLGQNLLQDHAGVWQIRFVGKQLKVAQVKGVINIYAFPFPIDLVPLLDEYLSQWRPKLAAAGETHVFLNSRGKPFIRSKDIADMIARTCFRFTGVGVTPHMFRDIWATEYLEANFGDVGGCARRLGNTPEMIMAHYAHILKRSADERAQTFLRTTLTS